MKAFVIMGRALKAVYDELFLCVYLSVLWWVGAIPLLLVIYAAIVFVPLGWGVLILGIPLMLLALIPSAAATNGLTLVANRAANYKRVDSSFFWEGARANIRRSWLLYVINIGIPILLGINIWFYFAAEGYWRFLGIFFVWLLILAFMMGQYVFPLFWQQDEPDIKLVLRNAALLAMRYPLYTFLLLLFQIVILAVSTAITLPLFLLAPAVVAMAANFGLAGILQDMGLAPMPPVVPKR
jgi:hypothetical protein